MAERPDNLDWNPPSSIANAWSRLAPIKARIRSLERIIRNWNTTTEQATDAERRIVALQAEARALNDWLIGPSTPTQPVTSLKPGKPTIIKKCPGDF